MISNPDYQEEKIQDVQNQLRVSAGVKDYLRENCSKVIVEIANVLIAALLSGKKLLLCGNGGSAADSQHFAAELIGRFQYNRPPLPAIALSTDTSILTAVSNDFDFSQIFSRQVQALGHEGDVLVAISTSGNSENALQALHSAKEKKMTCIVLTGRDGGKMASAADYAIIIPEKESQRIQEGHITIIHLWCSLIEKAMFPSP